MSSIDHTPEILKPKQSTIVGAFQNEPISIEHYEVPGSNKLVINLHGTFGNMHGSSGKYQDFATDISWNELAHAVLYSSSRDWTKAKKLDDSYESKIAIFQGKTFTEELEDARRVVSESIRRLKDSLSEGAKIEVTLNGNSLGGILAFYLAQEFPEIQAIVSVGTGLRTEMWSVPILSTFPDIDSLKEVLSAYTGKFLMQFGTNDNIFSEKSFEALFQAVWTEQKSYVRYIWVDHSFKSVNGESSEKIYQTATDQLKYLLQTGELIQGELRLDTPSQTKALEARYAQMTNDLVALTGNPHARVSLEDENPLW